MCGQKFTGFILCENTLMYFPTIVSTGLGDPVDLLVPIETQDLLGWLLWKVLLLASGKFKDQASSNAIS